MRLSLRFGQPFATFQLLDSADLPGTVILIGSRSGDGCYKNGTIQVKSYLGVGTTFTVTLPILTNSEIMP